MYCYYTAASTMNSMVVVMPIIDMINPRPPFLPQAIPSSIADRLVRLHGHPFVWWLGQLLFYILRPQLSLLADIRHTTAKIGFKGPIVGFVFQSFCTYILKFSLSLNFAYACCLKS